MQSGPGAAPEDSVAENQDRIAMPGLQAMFAQLLLGTTTRSSNSTSMIVPRKFLGMTVSVCRFGRRVMQ